MSKLQQLWESLPKRIEWHGLTCLIAIKRIGDRRYVSYLYDINTDQEAVLEDPTDPYSGEMYNEDITPYFSLFGLWFKIKDTQLGDSDSTTTNSYMSSVDDTLTEVDYEEDFIEEIKIIQWNINKILLHYNNAHNIILDDSIVLSQMILLINLLERGRLDYKQLISWLEHKAITNTSDSAKLIWLKMAIDIEVNNVTSKPYRES